MISLIDAPRDRTLKIVAILGGEGVRRRLFSLGFHKDDLLEVNSQALFRGPLLVKNLTSDASVALGRGVAQKIMVEIFSDEK